MLKKLNHELNTSKRGLYCRGHFEIALILKKKKVLYKYRGEYLNLKDKIYRFCSY